jgi:lipoprotein-releasing system permease protein
MKKKSLKNNMYELWIASRYTRFKNKNNFISFISLTSIIGIALGVMALIIVLSVMNGFQSELKTRILSVASHLEISKPGKTIQDWQNLQAKIKTQEGVKDLAPFVESQVMLALGKYNRGVIIRGIEPSLEGNVSDINLKIVKGAYSLEPSKFNILIGVDIARTFSLTVGDKITVMSSQSNYSPAGMIPRLKRFVVSGIFEIGMHSYDSGLVLINMQDAQKFFQMGSGVSGLRIKINDLNQTKSISSKLKSYLHSVDQLYLSDWTMQHANLFAAIQMEKKVMFIILTLMIAVAAFNIVSSLVMGVTEKRGDIAILRTLGASQKSIMCIFIAQGSLIGIIGTFFGVLFGVLISINIDVIIPFIENLFNTQFLSKDIYYISKVPSKLLVSDIYVIGLMGLFLSFIATIYPSYKASKINPAEALKHE